MEIRDILLNFALRDELRIMEKNKLTLIIVAFVSVFLAIACTVGNNGKQAQISEIVSEISHEHICDPSHAMSSDSIVPGQNEEVEYQYLYICTTSFYLFFNGGSHCNF